MDLKDVGITHVWFPPPSESAAREGYLPRELNNLNSAYGQESALVAATAALRSQGISSVADIVINHRVGNYGWGDFNNPAWGCSAVVNNDEWAGRCGGNDSGDSYSAARDIDHSQGFVQSDIKNWMNERLKGVGFSGWRYDYSRGYAPYYAKLYHDATNPNFCVGEVWTDLDYNNVNAHRRQLTTYVDGTSGTCGVFDFTTKGLLNLALQNGEYWRLADSTGQPAGGIGWWAQKMVTFVDNHDTGPSASCGSGQNHWPVPCDKVMQGYAYILSHPGIPTVYYPHVYNWGLRDPIKSLINLRRQAGVTSTSTVAIRKAEQNLYAAIIQGGTGQIAVKIGSGTWNPGSGWQLMASGIDYAAWYQSSATTGTDPTAGSGAGGTCNVQVTFKIANANTVWGDTVYVVGNLAQLGQWSPAKGFALTIQGSGANALWSGTLQLPAGQALQYKFVKWNGSRAVWESNSLTSSGNREWTPGNACDASVVQDDGSFRL